jgi:hypothetical protein
MKHIKNINELLKSTYVSAANKALGYEHIKRHRELLKYAGEKGQNVPVDRIFPHKFVFDYISGYDFTTYVKPYTEGGDPPYFYITDWKMKTDGVSHDGEYFVAFYIIFESNYGKKMKLECRAVYYEQVSNFKSWIHPSIEEEDRRGQYFKFNNKKDAVQLKKFIVDDLMPEFLEDITKYLCSSRACNYILDKFDNEDDKFFYLDGDGIPSIYIGFFKNIPVNSMMRETE